MFVFTVCLYVAVTLECRDLEHRICTGEEKRETKTTSSTMTHAQIDRGSQHELVSRRVQCDNDHGRVGLTTSMDRVRLCMLACRIPQTSTSFSGHSVNNA